MNRRQALIHLAHSESNRVVSGGKTYRLTADGYAQLWDRTSWKGFGLPSLLNYEAVDTEGRPILDSGTTAELPVEKRPDEFLFTLKVTVEPCA